jgi:hypothetical protein
MRACGNPEGFFMPFLCAQAHKENSCLEQQAHGTTSKEAEKISLLLYGMTGGEKVWHVLLYPAQKLW